MTLVAYTRKSTATQEESSHTKCEKTKSKRKQTKKKHSEELLGRRKCETSLEKEALSTNKGTMVTCTVFCSILAFYVRFYAGRCLCCSVPGIAAICTSFLAVELPFSSWHSRTTWCSIEFPRAMTVTYDNAIDRSHRVGKVTAGGVNRDRPILVKFTCYKYKEAMMKARCGLNKIDATKIFPDSQWPALPARSTARVHRLYINEDLTRTRAEVTARARQLKRDGKLDDTWVGIIFVKKGDTGSPPYGKSMFSISV